MRDDLARHGLFHMGVLADPDTVDSHILLIGTAPGFWGVFDRSPEAQDGLPDPVDRYSKRILSYLAEPLGAKTVYPSDGPPYAPFIRWALATGRFHTSPVGMLVHDTAGLMISIRGAVIIPRPLPEPPTKGPSPCLACAVQPCRTACPVDALKGAEGYDVTACQSHLATAEGKDCMHSGCRARRACPLSRSFARDPAQSAYHMRSFMGQL